MRYFIKEILENNFGNQYEVIFDRSPLLQYLDYKMGAINGNSKTRRSLATIYAIYSLVHCYVEDFSKKPGKYKDFQGFQYNRLFSFCRSLYGGEKLQNHALNNRVNLEFKTKTKEDADLIVIHDHKYLIVEPFLFVNGTNLSKTIVEIIKKYIELLKEKDANLISDLDELLKGKSAIRQRKRISSLITETTEARIFEIISFAVLKNHYKNTRVFIGFTKKDLEAQFLTLYKTGRANANDGGIDFVMRPLGRFFQVTEVESYSKYLLDIDKVMHFPITFVVKTKKSSKTIFSEITDFIDKKYGGMKVIRERTRNSIEEIITINELNKWLERMPDDDVRQLVKDIEFYYKMEMNLL